MHTHVRSHQSVCSALHNLVACSCIHRTYLFWPWLAACCGLILCVPLQPRVMRKDTGMGTGKGSWWWKGVKLKDAATAMGMGIGMGMSMLAAACVNRADPWLKLWG